MESSPEKPKVGFFNANRKKDKKLLFIKMNTEYL